MYAPFLEGCIVPRVVGPDNPASGWKIPILLPASSSFFKPGCPIGTHADLKSRLHTDESNLCLRVGAEFATHETVSHGTGEYARGDVTTNMIKRFFGMFKRGMRCITALRRAALPERVRLPLQQPHQAGPRRRYARRGYVARN